MIVLIVESSVTDTTDDWLLAYVRLPSGLNVITGGVWSATLDIDALVTLTLTLPDVSFTLPAFKLIVELPVTFPPVIVITYLIPFVIEELVILEIEIAESLDKVKALLVKVEVATPSLSVQVRTILVVSPVFNVKLPNDPNVQTGASTSNQWA